MRVNNIFKSFLFVTLFFLCQCSVERMKKTEQQRGGGGGMLVIPPDVQLGKEFDCKVFILTSCNFRHANSPI